jgi:hypothetical protein
MKQWCKNQIYFSQDTFFLCSMTALHSGAVGQQHTLTTKKLDTIFSYRTEKLSNEIK